MRGRQSKAIALRKGHALGSRLRRLEQVALLRMHDRRIDVGHTPVRSEGNQHEAAIAPARVGDVLVVLELTRFAIGMDNTCQYYTTTQRSPAVDALAKIANDTKTGLGAVGVYASQASVDVKQALLEAAKGCAKRREAVSGITASGSGFYGCQGREVGRFKGHIKIPDLIDRLGKMRLPAKVADQKEDQRVVNVEMENSAICFLSGILGYRAGTVCAIIATRAGDKRDFLAPDAAAAAIADAIVTGLNAMLALDAK